MQPLNDVETSINEKYKKNPPIIYKVVLNRFDQEALSKAMMHVKDLPVKLFINCKNSKRKVATAGSKKKLPNADDEHYLGGNDSDADAQTEGVITKEEVYFSGKENIEGFACLVQIFLRQLLGKTTNPAIVNVDNDEPFDEQHIRKGQLFYQSTIQFQDTFTRLLGKQIKDIKTITVKVNYKSIKDNFRKQHELCEKTFAYLGLKDTIIVK